MTVSTPAAHDAGDGLATLSGPRPGAVRATVVAELRHEVRLVLAAVLATLTAAAAATTGPPLIRRAIDDGVAAGDTSTLGTATVLYLVALVLGGLAGGARTTLMAIAGERMLHRLRTRALAGVLRLDLGGFERTRRGDLLSRVTADTEALSGAARWVIPDSIRYVADLAAALVALAVLSPTLAALTLVAVPPTAAAGRALRRRSRVVYPHYRREVGQLVGQLTETVEGADTVRAFGRQHHRLGLLATANRDVTRAYLDGTRMRNRFYASLTVTSAAATATMLVTASLLAMGGRITVGTAAAGLLAVSGVFGPLGWFTQLLDDALSAKASLDRVVAVADVEEPTVAVDGPGASSLPARGDLEFRGVDFSYLPGRPVLHGIGLDVRSGERLALVGETGSGKSTIARIAAGLARPDRGSVTYAGIDLTEAAPNDRRRRFVLVPQEAFCVAGTIADNVRLARPDATDADIIRAADELAIGPWLRSDPHGVDRPVGPGGVHLSAGERQLVGLLRVAVTDPAVVVLDEATAVLDPDTERLVGTALDRALAGRTVIVIAHRPETAARCDRIAIVAGGRIQRVGPAGGLDHHDGRYPHPGMDIASQASHDNRQL